MSLTVCIVQLCIVLRVSVILSVDRMSGVECFDFKQIHYAHLQTGLVRLSYFRLVKSTYSNGCEQTQNKCPL